MTNTTQHPPMTIDTLAVAIAAHHYSHVMFYAMPDHSDATDVARECARRAAELADATTTTFDMRNALFNYVADDLSDYAHNANHADYAPLFDVDPDASELFDMFISDELADRVTTILYPIIHAAYLTSSD